MLSVRNRSESIALWEIESGRMVFFSFFVCVPDDEEDVQEQHTHTKKSEFCCFSSIRRFDFESKARRCSSLYFFRVER
jgi:hypothetical protein